MADPPPSRYVASMPPSIANRSEARARRAGSIPVMPKAASTKPEATKPISLARFMICTLKMKLGLRNCSHNETADSATLTTP